MPIGAPFNLQSWINEHRHLLRPPVGNHMLHNGDFRTLHWSASFIAFGAVRCVHITAVITAILLSFQPDANRWFSRRAVDPRQVGQQQRPIEKQKGRKRRPSGPDALARIRSKQPSDTRLGPSKHEERSRDHQQHHQLRGAGRERLSGQGVTGTGEAERDQCKRRGKGGRPPMPCAPAPARTHNPHRAAPTQQIETGKQHADGDRHRYRIECRCC